MFAVDYIPKEMFFDSAVILRKLNQAERRVLSKQGSFLRRRAKGKLRRTAKYGRGSRKRGQDGRFAKSQRVARPGQPPIIRTRSKLATLRAIFFAYMPSEHSVFVGPRGFGGGSEAVPGLLEKGGSSSVPMWARGGSDVWNFGRVRGPGIKSRTVRAKYAEHPFMGPSLEDEIAAGTIAGPWAGSVQ